MRIHNLFSSLAVMLLLLLICFSGSFFTIAEADDEPEVLTAIASSDVYYSGFLIAVGDVPKLEESQYALENEVSYLVAYNDSGGEALLMADISGWETVDVQTVGLYNVNVHLCIDDPDIEDGDYVLAPELEDVDIPVLVSQPETFELFCARTTAESHVIYCLPDLHENDRIYAYSSEQPCNADQLDSSQWTLCDAKTASISQNGFFIRRDHLPEQWYTYFYVQMENVRSQYIGIFEDGDQTKVISMGGDRDGSDNITSPMPAVSQPAPVIPETTPSETHTTITTVTHTQADLVKVPNQTVITNVVEERDDIGSIREEHKKKTYSVNHIQLEMTTAKTTAASETVTTQIKTTAAPTMLEYSDGNLDTISGYRLRCMFEQSDNAVFSKNGITLSIPQGAFSYADTDTITVSIMQKGNGNYIIQITVNDETVSLQKEVTLWFPESLFSQNTEPKLEVNGAAQLLKYDADSHAYRMNTNYLGVFSISAAETTNHIPYWIFWLAVGIMIIELGVVLFLHLRKQNR